MEATNNKDHDMNDEELKEQEEEKANKQVLVDLLILVKSAQN
jgi:hypothetical protein